MRQTVTFAVLTLISLAALGCTGTATVAPAPVKVYSLEQGSLNTPMLGVGYVVALNPANNTAYLLQASTIAPSQISVSSLALKQA
jgi:hypothetical protein